MNINLKIYDILSSLIPGFLLLILLFNAINIKYEKDFIVIYTAAAFVLGYLINTIGSWLEDFYFFTWGGKPSNRLLNGKGIWKVKFCEHEKAKSLLIKEAPVDYTNDDLFNIAMRYANGLKDSRVDDFNSLYVFSRSILTTAIISLFILIVGQFDSLYYFCLIPLLVVFWIRCKQRGYFYAKEVLNTYLKIKDQSLAK